MLDHNIAPAVGEQTVADGVAYDQTITAPDGAPSPITLVLAEDGSIQGVGGPVIKALGYTPVSLSGKPIFRLINEHDLLNVFRGITDLASGRESVADMEVRLRTADGRWRVFRAVSHVRLDDAGVVEILMVLSPARFAIAS